MNIRVTQGISDMYSACICIPILIPHLDTATLKALMLSAYSCVRTHAECVYTRMHALKLCSNFRRAPYPDPHQGWVRVTVMCIDCDWVSWSVSGWARVKIKIVVRVRFEFDWVWGFPRQSQLPSTRLHMRLDFVLTVFDWGNIWLG